MMVLLNVSLKGGELCKLNAACQIVVFALARFILQGNELCSPSAAWQTVIG